MKKSSSRHSAVSDRQALALDEGVAVLLLRFKLEPSLIAGNPYANLQANDVGLLVAISEAGKWNVRKIANELRAPISTISSALDRLETRGLVTRRRESADRRVVYIELTAAGSRLVTRIRHNQVETCRDMLARLNASEREQLIRLVSRLAQG
jgi:DNA-binding MarR family transcriptional regulator